MLNAERLLGNLVVTALSTGLRGGQRLLRSKSGVLGGTMGSVVKDHKAIIGMGLLGLAIGAYEHFSQQRNSHSPQPSPNSPPPIAPMPEPPQVVNWSPPPLPDQSVIEDQKKSIWVLIRAMIAAANADHNIDEVERQKILAKIDENGLSEPERQFLIKEMDSPLEIQSIAQQVNSQDVAEQVYLVSIIAMFVDSEAEKNYLKRLARALNLTSDVTTRLEEALRAQTQG